jgi:oligoendopeptidase F
VQKSLTKGLMAIEAYLNYLKSGSSDVPIEVLKKAGVDMTSNQATKDALVVFEDRLKQLEEILLK